MYFENIQPPITLSFPPPLSCCSPPTVSLLHSVHNVRGVNVKGRGGKWEKWLWGQMAEMTLECKGNRWHK
jgi:hypothetical protein